MASRGYDYGKDGTKYLKSGWRARVKVKYREFYLGNYPTKREAEEVEYQFKVGGDNARI